MRSTETSSVGARMMRVMEYKEVIFRSFLKHNLHTTCYGLANGRGALIADRAFDGVHDQEDAGHDAARQITRGGAK